jgi:hypothetical protein
MTEDTSHDERIAMLEHQLQQAELKNKQLQEALAAIRKCN